MARKQKLVMFDFDGMLVDTLGSVRLSPTRLVICVKQPQRAYQPSQSRGGIIRRQPWRAGTPRHWYIHPTNCARLLLHLFKRHSGRMACNHDKRFAPQHQSGKSLDCSVVLLHDVVHILYLNA